MVDCRIQGRYDYFACGEGVLVVVSVYVCFDCYRNFVVGAGDFRYFGAIVVRYELRCWHLRVDGRERYDEFSV